MKKKFLKIFVSILMPAILLCMGFYCAFSSDVFGASALSGNGGIVFVGNKSVFNMSSGSLSGGSATNGGAVYVASGGTFNLSGGTISGNTATTGKQIYNNGTFIMTGGSVRQSAVRVDANGKVSATGEYVLFGNYPQTIKASNVTVDETNVDENGYFVGSDGNKYAKIVAQNDVYGNSSKYKFSNGSSISSGTAYYFKVEPIKWKILSESNGKLSLYCTSIVDQSIWNTSYLALNYKSSIVRSFLNGSFLNTAFSANEQAIISSSTVDNSASSLHSDGASYACENTQDKVYLLSYANVKDGGTYGFSTSTRYKPASDFAKAKGLFVSESPANENTTMYWTRSPSGTASSGSVKYASMVATGVLMSGGIEANLGVVPGITISYSAPSGYGIYNTGTMNLYGGNVYDEIYSSATIKTKMGANLANRIVLGNSATISVQDYAGVTPQYTISVSSSRGAGTLITFVGTDTEPNLSALNISGYNSGEYVLKTQKDANGNWTVALCENTFDFPSTWKNEVASNDYMSSIVTPTNLTSIKFVSSVPTGYTKIGTLSTGLPVYKGSSINDIAFVAKKIYAPENCGQLFCDLTKLTSIDFETFNTTKVTNMSYMFYACTGLTSLNLSNFDTSNVKEMNEMFHGCSNLITLDLRNFDTSKVTNMSAMFYSCSSLTSLNVSNFDTTNVTDISGMFHSCSSLTRLNVSIFNTTSVENIRYIFYGCSGLTSLDLSNFDTTKVKNMESVFTGCSGLTSLDLSNFDTTKVTIMFKMFDGCLNLKTLNISSFNMTKVTNFTDMLNFGSSNKIETLKTPYGNTSALPITTGSTLYNKENGDIVSSIPANTSKSMTLVNKNPFTFLPKAWKNEVSSSDYMTTTITEQDIREIRFEKSAPSGYSQIGTLSTGIKVYRGNSNTSQIAFVCADTIYAPVDSSSLFLSAFGTFSSISFNNFDTSKATTMSSFFMGGRYTTLDLSSFDTRNVKDFSNFSPGTSNLTSITFGTNFKTTNATTMFYMFASCSGLTSLDLSGFDTTNVTSMYYMFYNCKNLTSLDLSNFNTSNVTEMTSMFNGCSALETLDLSSFDMSKTSSFANMLNFGSSNKIKVLKTPYGNSSAISIYTGSSLYATANGTQYTSVPASLSSSITLRVAQTVSFDYNGGSGNESSRTVLYGLAIGTLPSGTQSGYTLDGWYTLASGGTKISSAKIITENSTFYAQWSSSGTGGGGTGGGGGTVDPDPDPDPDPPTPTESAIEYAEYIFFTTRSGVPSGLSLNDEYEWSSRSFFDGSSPNVYTSSDGKRVAFVGEAGDLIAPADCTEMFANMQYLKWVVFRNYDTYNSTSFQGMFKECPNLEYVDFLPVQTPNVTTMREMFSGCTSLKQIALAEFDCISLQDASYMFYNCSSLGTGPIFSGTTYGNKTIYDIPHLKYTYNLSDASYMFAGCSGWGSFSMPYMFTDNLSGVTGMFENTSFKILNLSQFVCLGFDATDLFGEGAGAPEMVLTPRNCEIVSFFESLGSTYLFADGYDYHAFADAGYIGNVPFSVCLVRDDVTSSSDYYFTQYTLYYDGDASPSEDYQSLLQYCFNSSTIFYGDFSSITFSTYVPPYRDAYYLLPNPYNDFTRADGDLDIDWCEGPYAGWIWGDVLPGSKEDLSCSDFVDRWGFGDGGTFMLLGWHDNMESCPINSDGGDITISIQTQYYDWYNNDRYLLARIRYLPSVHYSGGRLFTGWELADGTKVTYYMNITRGANDGVIAAGEDLNMYIGHDHVVLPQQTSSFVPNGASSNEKSFEELNKLFQMNSQEVLIPEDRKVTITELKLKKVS